MAGARRIQSEDIFKLYKNSYGIAIPWKFVSSEKVDNWLTLYEKATNCAKTMVTSSLISLTAVLYGPLTKVAVESCEFATVMNQFIVNVCAPGGGKSNTFYRILDPVFENIKRKHGLNLQLETYTTAGLQKHQSENSGYGLVTGDEGHRFLTSINVKQSKGEGERALLCKMWGGKGDSSTLVTGQRGFERTSISCCLFIQPQPLMQELVCLGGDDGLIDRFLFFVARPVFHPSSVTKTYIPRLKETGLLDVVDIMTNIYEEHVKGCLYTLTREAEQTFEALSDSSAEFINSKYGYDEEDDKENEMISQENNLENTLTITSKDTTHILRLSTVLHIVQHKITGALENQRPSQTPTEIQDETIKQAMMLYNAIAQWKSLFMQTVESFEKENAHSRIKPSMIFRDRVLRVLCNAKSPCVSVRYMQNYLKGSLAQNIKIELELIERRGFGKFKTIRTRHGVRDLFYKLHPSCIDEEVGDHEKMLKSVSVSLESYAAAFEDLSAVSEKMKMLIIEHRPQAELIESLW